MPVCALKAKHRVEVFNLGTDHYVQVNDSIRYICTALGLKPRLEFTGGDRGWVGDDPFIFLDTRKIRALGWEPKHTISQGVIKTVEFLKASEWVFEAREDSVWLKNAIA